VPGVALPLAILLNLKTFGLAVLILVGLLVAVTLLYRHPTRPCHRCGARVRLERRTCPHCGYDFEPVRFTS
jgi:predicted amidophosphoribosyltransferase